MVVLLPTLGLALSVGEFEKRQINQQQKAAMKNYSTILCLSAPIAANPMYYDVFCEAAERFLNLKTIKINIMVQHILPINDSDTHEEATTCHCQPKVLNENGNMIVVHNSFDGREGVEWANEILNN